MLEINHFTLPKLGKREYIHGTTLYECLMAQIKDYSFVEFLLKKPIFSNEVAVYHISSWDPPKDAESILFYEKDGIKGCKYVKVINDQRHENLRVSYDESEYLFSLEKSSDFIRIHQSPYNFIKTIIPINKLLLSKYLRPDFLYIFTFLKLESYIPLDKRDSIILKESKQIGTFYYTDIYVDNKKVGILGFRQIKITDFRI